MAEIIRVQDDYYILATSALADSRTRVLKDGDTFALFDRSGDIRTLGRGELGVYHRGTRYLSRLELRIGEGVRPLLLHSSVKSDNEILTVDLTNPDEVHEGVVRIERDTFHLLRSSFLNGSVFHSRIRVRSFDAAPGPYVVRLRFAADFVDIFEVRGMKRPQRGELLEPVVDDDGVLLSYRGLDGIALRSRIDFHPRPTEIRADEAVFRFQIAPGREEMIYLSVSCVEGEDMETSRPNLPNAFLAKSGPRRAPRPTCRITTSHEQFDEWIERSVADLDMLTTELPTGPYPDAGVPWFSTRFGRDGIITALQCLWFYPELARGVLGYLAQTQAREIVAEKDAEPGKILHEARDSEMARLGEIPFGQYYGTVDATPLFVMLAGAYYRRTGDVSFAEYIWPHVEAALEWIDRFGDINGDGFVEYEKKTPNGLDQQGWKDSHDSVYHADGTPAKPPIALCEVQGYVYAAWRAAAELGLRLGHSERSFELRQRALALQNRFDETYWCPELGTYAMALDGDGKPCRIRTSNAGQLLFTGIVPAYRVDPLVRTLMSDASFSGWGIRTLAAGEPRYNPMSYHRGSIWPHDTALIAAGFAEHGHHDELWKVFAGMLDASILMDLHRLPELFCGFQRRPGEGPSPYPVACAPQAWACGVVFLLLEASLRPVFDVERNEVRFRNPRLPPFLEHVEIRNLSIGPGTVDVQIRRLADGTIEGEVLARRGEVRVVVEKSVEL